MSGVVIMAQGQCNSVRTSIWDLYQVCCNTREYRGVLTSVLPIFNVSYLWDLRLGLGKCVLPIL